MNFRTRIKELCEERGMTQKSLAQKLGITDISLNKTLRGQYPQLQTLEKIAIALNVEIWQLFTSSAEVSDNNPDTCTVSANCPHCGKPITVKTSATIE